ncbi:uncharacterized protein LOC143341114 isoform X2 [Colletes latitarsis]|uniref:uncharacterized protein LOC143341114 isoform X2 n=1 Tax=Colletes latitarsis TaxID=2605962 RepID=UPI004036956C
MKLATLFLIIFVVGAFARPDRTARSAADVDEDDSSASMGSMMQGEGDQGDQMTAALDIKHTIEDLYQTYVPGFMQTIIEIINTIIPGIITGPISIPLEALHTTIMQSDFVESLLTDNFLTNMLTEIPILGNVIPYIAQTIGMPLNIVNFIITLISTIVFRVFGSRS